MAGDRALAYVLNSHWAMTEEAIRTVIAIAARTSLGPEAVEAERGERLDNSRMVTVRNGVATIPVRGVLMRYGNIFGRVSGATSFDVLATDIRTALDDPTIKALLLAVDSPGGEVAGTEETAQLLYEGRERKPIVAHIDGSGASAAYWLASAAREVVVGSTAIAGSIGIRLAIQAQAEGDRKQGIETITIISSQSPRKEADPKTAEGRAQYQAILDHLGAVFINTVARNRGVTADVVLSDFGQGGVFVGSDAVAAGLANRVATYESLHAELEAQYGSRRRIGSLLPSLPSAALRSARSITSKESRMPPTTDPEAPSTVAELAAAFPEQVTQIRAAAATAERERITAISALAEPGLEALIRAAQADPTCSADAAARRILEHQRQAKSDRLGALAEDGSEAKPPATPTPPAEPNGPAATAARIKATIRTIHQERDNSQRTS